LSLLAGLAWFGGLPELSAALAGAARRLGALAGLVCIMIILLTEWLLLSASLILVAGFFAFVFHYFGLLHKRPACSRTAEQGGGVAVPG
jgi:hypothetical protein